MTQALALKQFLEEAGHQVCRVMVGKSESRRIPGFFTEKIGLKVDSYESPNFVTDKKKKGIRIIPTITHNFMHGRRYIRSMRFIRDTLRQEKPDVIINFYEMLFGIHNIFYPHKIPIISIGHQYTLQHPDFVFPRKGMDKFFIDMNTRVATKGTRLKLALSFRPMPDVPGKKIKVVPPLLRDAIFKLKPTKGDFLLVYILNSGYGQDLMDWHRDYPDVKVHAFWDNPEVEDEWQYDENLTFHHLSDVKFLEKLSTCKGFMTTAGFESVCEAMYLGKPVFLRPTDGHYEQECNALDAEMSGAGIRGPEFEFNRFLEYIPTHSTDYETYRKWVQSAGERFLDALENWDKQF